MKKPKKTKTPKPSGRRYKSVEAMIKAEMPPLDSKKLLARMDQLDQFSYHEALDRVEVLRGHFEAAIMAHAVVVCSPALFAAACRAEKALDDLSREAAKLHIEKIS